MGHAKFASRVEAFGTGIAALVAPASLTRVVANDLPMGSFQGIALTTAREAVERLEARGET